jgi:cation diffusion facilitator family transporter
MGAGGQGIGHILRALGANFMIAVAKGVGAVITGSGAMLAETIHSLSDCVNQLLLILGIKQARRPPDDRYPLGQGRNLYFWSFMVALLLFLGGGAYSIYEGVHKLRHPEPISNPLVAIGILSFGFALEMWALLGVIKVANQRRGKTPFWTYLRQSKDSDVIVIFGEDLAAVLGLGLALIAVGVAMVTGDPRWDAVGTLAIGGVLVGVAIFLAVEVKSLLVGESADPLIAEACRAIAAEDPHIAKVHRVIALQQGPGEVLVAMKIQFKGTASGDALCEVINELERRIEARMPEVKWTFVEPDNVD